MALNIQSLVEQEKGAERVVSNRKGLSSLGAIMTLE